MTGKAGPWRTLPVEIHIRADLCVGGPDGAGRGCGPATPEGCGVRCRWWVTDEKRWRAGRRRFWCTSPRRVSLAGGQRSAAARGGRLRAIDRGDDRRLAV